MKAALRRYLLSTANLRQVDPNREVFEAFLTQEVEPLFALREAAVVRFRQARWLAKQEKGPLPLTWEEVTETFARKGPRAGLETTLARELPAVLTQVFERLRKVLRREREPQAVGRVEQLDAACLRWLTRQPGYTVAQKAGPRQRVLAVVRREHYDILENRVLRDLLLRTERLAERWLEENERAFPGHATVRAVKRLGNLCRRGLELEALQGVAPLHDVPKPNYVLTQDALYRRIWDAYLLVVEHYRLIEGLWDRWEELADALAQWCTDAEKYADSFHRSELWVCPIKNGKPWVEEYPRFAVRKKARAPYWGERAEGGHVTVDLLGLHLSDVLLMPDDRHPNAKPRLIDFDAPYVDFRPADEPKHRHRGRYLLDILRERDQRGLAAYFEQLHGAIGGSDWTILVADDWEPDWLEAIKQAASAALGSSNVFLLWRTVAYALGADARTPAIAVPRLNGPCDKVWLKYDTDGRPCHHAYRFHKEEFDIPELPKFLPVHSLFDWLWDVPDCRDLETADTLRQGVARFWAARAKKEGAYWDERMGLYVVVQTQDEHVMFKTLVPYSDRHEGGRPYQGTPNDNFRLDAQKRLKLYLLEGHEAKPDEQLKYFECALREPAEKERVTFVVTGSPGQGVSRLEVSSSTMKHPEELLLANLQAATRLDRNKETQPETLASLEESLPRSFPPLSPRVMASDKVKGGALQLTSAEQIFVAQYIAGKRVKLNGGLFAKAKDRFPRGVPIPAGESPLERLRRINIFGAEKDARRPAYDWDFDALNRRLAKEAEVEITHGDYNSALRLIAWTYQYDEPLFRKLRKRCLERVVNQGMMHQVLISFCSNLCSDPEEWKQLFLICRLPPPDGANGAGRQRLLYNLLMFHDTFVEAVGLVKDSWDGKGKRATPVAYALVDKLYDIIRAPKTSSIYRCACLRSLIYLLRIRHYDGKRFATKEHDRAVYEKLLLLCKDKYRSDVAHSLQKVLSRYLRGKGRIDDLLF